MTYTETLAAYEAARAAHDVFYNEVRLPANKAHFAGEMSDADYIAVRNAEKVLLAEFDALYAVISEMEPEEEMVDADPEFAF